MALGRHPMVDPSRQMMQPRSDVSRSAFSVRDFHKTTFGIGTLVPFFWDEVLPGDSLRTHMSALVRLANPIVPVMDNLYFQTFFFFVPFRLVWDHWEQFIAGPKDAADTTRYLVPQIPVVNADCSPGSIADYLGLTVNGSANSINVSALPFRAYSLIWNEWFRSQQLQNAVVVSTGDGPDAMISYGTFAVSKRHDYFTSALPWPQAVTHTEESGNIGAVAPGGRMVLGDLTYGVGVPVHGFGKNSAARTAGPLSNVRESGGRLVTYGDYYTVNPATQPFYVKSQPAADYPDVRVLVNDIRTANMLQRVLEHQARGGGRYTEYLSVVFGVRPQDSRLQRPEFLGGGRTMVTINPVAQTSQTYTAVGTDFAKTVLGQQAANGYIAATDHGFSHSFPEHGIVMGIGVVRSDLTYQQGVERKWRRKSQFDFYRPETAFLGEQAILSSEIYCDGSAGDSDVFGYQERWAEYRTRLSRTSGYMRSVLGGGASGVLDMWHFGEKFASRPTLNGSSFLPDLAPVDRVMPTGQPYYAAQFLADVMFESTFVRPIPMFSVPSVGDRL